MGSITFEKLLFQLEKLHPKFIDLSLDRLLKLLKKLDNPHLKLPKTIHIAGTNGKGSTLSFIHQILKEHQYKVHCYISPHLESIEERFILSNKTITKQKLFHTLQYIKKINNNEKITFFEITTAAAFYLFSKKKADFLILETGLGGKFDATNVIEKTIIDIITPISFDHKEFLGNNLRKITNEKLGIIKSSSTIIISKQKKEVYHYIKKKIKKLKNKILFYDKMFKAKKLSNNFFIINFKKKSFKLKIPSLVGNHQLENASVAIAAIYEINKLGYTINNKLVNAALINTKWPGRLEKGLLQKTPVFIDGAHNIGGAEQLSNFLDKRNKNTWVILGMLNNKDLLNFLQTIKKNISGVMALKIPDQKNSYTTKEIHKVCMKLDIVCVEKKNIKLCNQFLLSKIKPEQILVTGSLYFVGKVRKLFI